MQTVSSKHEQGWKGSVLERYLGYLGKIKPVFWVSIGSVSSAALAQQAVFPVDLLLCCRDS